MSTTVFPAPPVHVEVRNPGGYWERPGDGRHLKAIGRQHVARICCQLVSRVHEEFEMQGETWSRNRGIFTLPLVRSTRSHHDQDLDNPATVVGNLVTTHPICG